MEPRKKSMDFKTTLRTALTGLFADPLAKVVCLALAVMLWMYIVGAAEVESEFRDVPVEFMDLAANLAVSDDSQRKLTLRVRGPKTSISSLEATDFKVIKSLAEKREGEKWVQMSLENVASPRPDVEVFGISPGSLRVYLENVEGRRLRVAPKLQGEVPAGYRAKAVARPESVLVLGPMSLFQRMTEIPTEIIDISGRRATFSASVKLEKEMSSIRKMDPESVEVLVEIEENVLEKTLEGVRIDLQNPVPGQTVQIKPEKVSVRLRGPQNALDHLNPAQLRVEVELPPGKQFHLAVPRAINVPERVEIVSYEPALVRVSIPGQ